MYALVSAIVCSISAISTGVIDIKLHRHWNLRSSCVLWVFFMFFIYLTMASFCHSIIFVLIVIHGKHIRVNHKLISLTQAQLERLGMHSIAISNTGKNPWVAIIAVLNDTMVLGVALWSILLTYELFHIAIKSMDRGSTREHERIRLYNWSVHLLLFFCGTGQSIVAILHRGYTILVHDWLFAYYVLHTLSLLYMCIALTRIKVKGRQVEAMYGTFVPSPIYQRLRNIMMVYGAFSVQFYISSMSLGWAFNMDPVILAFINISLMIHNTTGIALAITVGCSQSCVLTTCRWCLPDDIEAQLLERRLQGLGLAPEQEVIPPQEDHPVFVYTDIESSTALWAVEERVMIQSIDLHDTILRSTLTRYQGYEINTCGDAFHLAFHSIKDAISYCMDVQLQLLVAPWPKALQSLHPSTKKQRYKHHLIFNGLRVRMGVHDCVQSIDGPLVSSLHVVTGKMIYTGASDIIAKEVCEWGQGGQTLVTKRIKEWLEMHLNEMEIEYEIRYLGHCEVAHVCQWLDVYEVTPRILAGRSSSSSSQTSINTSRSSSEGLV